MFTLNELGTSAELARTMVTTNLIESPNSVVRRAGKPTRLMQYHYFDSTHPK